MPIIGQPWKFLPENLHMPRQLLVTSQIQAKFLTEFLIPQMKTGFWKDHRPRNHGYQWDGVDIVVSNDKLGPVNFKVPRLYNFINMEFMERFQDELVKIAKSVKPSSNLKSVRKELIELSKIVGGRIESTTSEIKKAYGAGPRGPKNPLKQVATKTGKISYAQPKTTAVKNTTIPQVFEFVLNDGGNVIVRRVAVTRTEEKTI